METISFVLPFIIAGVVVIAIRILAGQDHILGRICRWFWNVSFKIVSYIPLCGWMSCFIIAKNDKERAEKNYYKQVGVEADRSGIEYLDRKAARDRAEEAERQERLRVESAINYALKRTDARILNEDVVEIGGKKYDLHGVKRKLGIN